MVAGDIATIAVIDFSLALAKHIPNGQPFAIFKSCAFNLIGCCCCPPHKTFWKLHMRTVLAFGCGVAHYNRNRTAYNVSPITSHQVKSTAKSEPAKYIPAQTYCFYWYRRQLLKF